MTWILFSVFALFLLFGMDVRKKKGMTTIVKKQYVVLMKFSSLVLLALYLDSLFNIKSIGLVEWTTLTLTATGAVLVMISKLGLRDSFSWTGHFLKDTNLITDGIYTYVRNPLYTGVFLFEAGAVTNFVFNGILISEHAISLSLIGTITLCYAIGFNIVMAKKEASKLEEQFGDEYRQYKLRTGTFFPKILNTEG